MTPVKEWHVVLSGFMQRQGDINGMVLIWQDLRRVVPSHAVLQLHSWNCNLPDLAELIARLAPDDARPRVNIYGYSWGGQSAIHLARQLNRRGLFVDHMVLSDAVYRHWYPLGWWRAFLPWLAIRVPDNVRRVTHFRQQRSSPCGHRLIAENTGKTVLDPVVFLPVEHCWMDDQPEFRAACVSAAKGPVQHESNSYASARVDQLHWIGRALGLPADDAGAGTE